jgi:hypothetical protein
MRVPGHFLQSGLFLIGKSQSRARIILISSSIICILSGLGGCGGGKGGSMMMEDILSDEIAEWEAEEPPRLYRGREIFDYMDGAGEIYLLYDFQRLLVRRYTRIDHPALTAELFDMGNSRDAYGVFSHAREGGEAGIGQGSELRGGLLCFWKNRYFVCITAERASEEVEREIAEFARTLSGRIESGGEPPAMLSILPQKDLIETSIRYFHKQASLNYHYYLSEQNLLNLTDDTECLLARYEPDKAYLLFAGYKSPIQAEEALQSFLDGYMPEGKEDGLIQTSEDQWTRALVTGNYVIVVFDAADAERASYLANAASAKIRNSIK